MNKKYIKYVGFLSLMLTPTLSYAQGGACPKESGNDTFGRIVNSVMLDTSAPFMSFLIALSFLAGIAAVASGLIQLIKDNDGTGGGRSSGISNGLLKIFAGAFLVALPVVVQVGATTFFGDSNLNTFSTAGGVCEPATSTAENMYQAFANFTLDSVDPLTQAGMVVAVILGIFLLITGLQRLANYKNPNSPHFDKMNSFIVRLIVGILFINFPFVIDAIGTSFSFDNTVNYRSILSHSQSAASGMNTGDAAQQYANMMQLIMYGLYPFGLFALISGVRVFYLAAEDTGGRSNFGQGVVRMVAGVLLLNMSMFSCAVMNTVSPGSANMIGFCS